MVTGRPPIRSGRSGRGIKLLALFLAIAVHLAFIIFLVFGVQWQNRPAQPVTAELYAPPTDKPAPPAPEPEPEPKPVPPPPPPTPKPAPPAENKPSKAQIELKAKQDKEKKERERREQEKREQQKRDQERKEREARETKAKAQQAREADALRQQAERERLAQQQAAQAALARAEADYVRRIQAKVRGNVVLPPEVPGNPEARFDIVQLPTGEIIDVQLRQSSGFKPYDDAVQRAILKSSPLPRPERPELFRRSITLKFRPKEEL